MHGEVNTFALYITRHRSRYKIIRSTKFSWTCFKELGLSFTRKTYFFPAIYCDFIYTPNLQKKATKGEGEGVLHYLNALKLDKISSEHFLLYTLHIIQLSRFEWEAPVFRRQLLSSRLSEISFFVLILTWMSDIYEFFKSIRLLINLMWNFGY